MTPDTVTPDKVGRVAGPAQPHAEQFGELGQRRAPDAGWTQIRKHGPRLPLITVR